MACKRAILKIPYKSIITTGSTLDKLREAGISTIWRWMVAKESARHAPIASDTPPVSWGWGFITY